MRIGLKGSCDVVLEFFECALNSILYQRGLYTADSFVREQRFGMVVFVAEDPALKHYLDQIMLQVREWINSAALSRLVVCLAEKLTGVVVERWQFDVSPNTATTYPSNSPRGLTSDKEMKLQIAAIIRQITSSVAFLPILDQNSTLEAQLVTFNVLAYTDKESLIPEKWEESGPRLIDGGEQVRLRSFSTSVHQVGGLVTFKVDE